MQFFNPTFLADEAIELRTRLRALFDDCQRVPALNVACSGLREAVKRVEETIEIIDAEASDDSGPVLEE